MAGHAWPGVWRTAPLLLLLLVLGCDEPDECQPEESPCGTERVPAGWSSSTCCAADDARELATAAIVLDVDDDGCADLFELEFVPKTGALTAIAITSACL